MALSPEEQRRLDELRLKVLRAKAAGSPAQATPTAKPEEPSMWDAAKEIGGRALDVGLKTLDMPGGVARVAWTGLEDIPALTGMTDREPTGKYPEDIYRALKGEAPTSDEYMARQGVEPGAARTAVGIVKDIALDPMTYMTLGAAPLAKQTAKAGKSIYKSGLKAIDLEAAKYGKEPVSELLMREGVTGSAEQIQKRMDDLAEGYKTQRDAVLKAADEAGGRVNMKEAMAPLREKINYIRKTEDPNLQRVADVMEADLNQYLDLDRAAYSEISYKPKSEEILSLPVQSEYKAPYRSVTTKAGEMPVGKVQPLNTQTTRPDQLGPNMTKYPTEFDVQMGQLRPEQYIQRPEVKAFVTEGEKIIPGKTVSEKFVTPSQGSGFKSSTYNQMPDSAYAQASRTPIGKALNKEKARGLKEAVESAVEKSSGKASAEELRELNDKLGRLLTTKKKAAVEAGKEIKKDAFTQVDALALAVEPKAYLLKQAAKAINMTGPRTKGGKMLMENAESLGQLQKNLLYTPWVGMKRYQQNEDNK